MYVFVSCRSCKESILLTVVQPYPVSFPLFYEWKCLCIWCWLVCWSCEIKPYVCAGAVSLMSVRTQLTQRESSCCSLSKSSHVVVSDPWQSLDEPATSPFTRFTEHQMVLNTQRQKHIFSFCLQFTKVSVNGFMLQFPPKIDQRISSQKTTHGVGWLYGSFFDEICDSN